MKNYLLPICMLIAVLLFATCAARSETADSGLWTDDYALALQKAKETSKPILINFTGSDWCGWCIRLSEEVFSQPEFIRYAEENLILFKADFPNKIPQSDELKAQNQTLAQKHNIEGFPTIVLIDREENVLGRTGYQRGGAVSYVQHLAEMVK